MSKYVEDQEVAKHHKKVEKKHKKSDHKHKYQKFNALIPSSIPNNNKMNPVEITYCVVCGKIKDVSFFWGVPEEERPAHENCILLEDFRLFYTRYLSLELINE